MLQSIGDLLGHALRRFVGLERIAVTEAASFPPRHDLQPDAEIDERPDAITLPRLAKTADRLGEIISGVTFLRISVPNNRGGCLLCAPDPEVGIMLQIIGWLGCAYLLVKAFEILGNQANRVKSWEQLDLEARAAKGEDVKLPEQPLTRLSVPSVIAMLCAFAGGVIFPIMLSNQAGQIAVTTAPVQTFSECMRSATTTDEMAKCHPD